MSPVIPVDSAWRSAADGKPGDAGLLREELDANLPELLRQINSRLDQG